MSITARQTRRKAMVQIIVVITKIIANVDRNNNIKDQKMYKKAKKKVVSFFK